VSKQEEELKEPSPPSGDLLAVDQNRFKANPRTALRLKRELESTDNEMGRRGKNEPEVEHSESSPPSKSQTKLKRRESKNIRKKYDAGNLQTVRKSTRLKEISQTLDDDFKGCTCKKSECVKLYCQCFMGKQFCSPSCT